MDTFHGSAYPIAGPGATQHREKQSGNTTARDARAKRRQWILRAGTTPASTPMWTTRSAWLGALRAWASAEVVRAVSARLSRCSISPATLIAVATVMAEYADHATGRNMSATRTTIAAHVGCTPRTVTTAWRLLRASGWATLASIGHGNTLTPSIGCRPSVWHLIPRRPVDNFHLPPIGGCSSVSHVYSYSPSALQRARQKSHSRKTPIQSRRPRPPRPIAIQRLAAELASRTHGIDRRRQHIGVICDAIANSGIDSEAWNGRQLQAALQADMRATGRRWPDHITHPAKFLTSRLRRLPTHPPGQITARTGLLHTSSQNAPTSTPPQYVPAPTLELTDHQRRRIAAAQQQCRKHIAETRRRRQLTPPIHRATTSGKSQQTKQRPQPHTAAPPKLCAVCGDQRGSRRPYLPPHRAYVCDLCWDEIN
jgi:hypothetical protein